MAQKGWKSSRTKVKGQVPGSWLCRSGAKSLIELGLHQENHSRQSTIVSNSQSTDYAITKSKKLNSQLKS